jgi:hypothetical protein
VDARPEFGERTPEYPHGYGYCQCGCGRRTQRFPSGSYDRWWRRHSPACRQADQQKREARRPAPGEFYILQSGTLGEVKEGYEEGWGFCQCGCGGRTNVISGRAGRFLQGHASRLAERRQAQRLLALKMARSRGYDGLVGRGSGVSGTRFSPKVGRAALYMSSYEMRAMEILDSLQNVEAYEEQLCSIGYKLGACQHEYTPDFLVRLDDGTKGLVEVKPKSRLSSQRVRAKIEAGRAFCEERGLFFLVWTEDFLFGSEHVRLALPDADRGAPVDLARTQAGEGPSGPAPGQFHDRQEVVRPADLGCDDSPAKER